MLDVVIKHNLALKTVVNNVDLLIFSSRVLPPAHWRKLYTLTKQREYRVFSNCKVHDIMNCLICRNMSEVLSVGCL